MHIELKDAINQCSLLVDRDNSFGYESFRFALQFLADQKQHNKRVVILYGKCYYDDYTALNKLFANIGVERLILIGDCWRAVKDQFAMSPKWYKNANDYIAKEQRGSYQQHAILLKGTQGMGLFNIERTLQDASQPTVLEVNLDALEHNLQVFRTRISAQTKVLVVLKASAYGNGTLAIAHALERNGVDYLAVSNADEGVELRNAGVELPIVVLTPMYENFELIIKYKLEPSMVSLQAVEKFAAVVQKQGVERYPVHIHFDTGHNRLGIQKHDVPELLNVLQNNVELLVQSMFSDLAASGNSKYDTFTKEQFRCFDTITEQVENILPQKNKILKHILNSDGIIRFADRQYNMVRLGLGVYGINKCIQEELIPISSLKSTISQTKTIQNGFTPTDGTSSNGTRIAIVPVGFADGIPRQYGELGAKVMIRGELMPVRSKVSMDMLVVDLKDEQVQAGDEVVFFGKDFTVVQLADLFQTEAYVILAGISKRVRRVYLKNRE